MAGRQPHRPQAQLTGPAPIEARTPEYKHPDALLSPMVGAAQAVEALFLVQLVAAPLAAVAASLLAGPGARSRIKWACFCLVLPFVILFVLYRRARGLTPDGEPRFTTGAPSPPPRRLRVQPPPVPVPSEEDLRDVPEPVSACPDCGFLGIRSPGVQDGVWPGGGELVFQVCPRCQFRGQPVVFRRREDYNRFVAELAEHAANPDRAP